MKHLGNNGTEYVSKYDSSLLERIEREPRRTGYTKMYGWDVWTAYEFSFLLPTGLPVYKVLRIVTDCNNPYIFESKSLKLYLNSFNNTVLTSIKEALDLIEKDLSEVAGGEVKVFEVYKFNKEEDFYKNSTQLYSYTSVDEYNYNKGLLRQNYLVLSPETEGFYTDLLRSNCEITNQPDWGRCFISYSPNGKNIDKDSLLKYIISYRNHQEFHEPTCERIFQDLNEILKPKDLLVICQYTRRGGIDINPIRSLLPLSDEIVYNLPKLLQQ